MITVPTRPEPVATSSRAGHHGLALRAPWYVCERGDFDRFDPRALTPAVQKYDSADLVARIMGDPRDSLKFCDEDQWSVTVSRPKSEQQASTGRLRFATHSFVRMGTCKLFQPNHDRFYAVVVEVFCDHDGLPRPHPDDDFAVAMVVRRHTMSLDLDDREVRRLARDVIRAKTRNGTSLPDLPRDTAVVEGRQAWMTDRKGGQGWVDVDASGFPVPTRPYTAYEDLDLEDKLTEQLIPMWQIPPSAALCPRAATRSLWFGLIPTFSGDHETSFDPDLPIQSHPGNPRYDDLATYEIRCRATRPPSPGQEQCPPEVFWSAATCPYRLATFFDPEGTKNRTVSITMPDLRAVAARAGQPPAGGVAITTPAGSQFAFNADNGTPSDGSVGGDARQTCTFALELFMIVAFFVFNLFLPVVMFLFQLWWLLLLKFCPPPSPLALALLKSHFDDKHGTLATMGKPERDAMDELLGGKGTTKKLAGGASGFAATDGQQLWNALRPGPHVEPSTPTPESSPDDPLCPPGGSP